MPRLNKTFVNFARRLIWLGLVAAVAMIVTNQYLLYRKYGLTKTPSESRLIRIADLYAENEKLKAELEQRESHDRDLASAAQNNDEVRKILNREKERYEIALGTKEVEGQGVAVEVSHTLAASQLIDLVNALRVSGAEAITLNGQRIITSTSVSSLQGQDNYRIEAIGNKDILYDAFTRPGGIFDLIADGTASRQESLVLPKV